MVTAILRFKCRKRLVRGVFIPFILTNVTPTSRSNAG